MSASICRMLFHHICILICIRGDEMRSPPLVHENLPISQPSNFRRNEIKVASSASGPPNNLSLTNDSVISSEVKEKIYSQEVGNSNNVALEGDDEQNHINKKAIDEEISRMALQKYERNANILDANNWNHLDEESDEDIDDEDDDRLDDDKEILIEKLRYLVEELDDEEAEGKLDVGVWQRKKSVVREGANLAENGSPTGYVNNSRDSIGTGQPDREEMDSTGDEENADRTDSFAEMDFIYDDEVEYEDEDTLCFEDGTCEPRGNFYAPHDDL